MPATAERPRPLPIPSLLDDSVPPRKRSPPPYTKLPDPKPISSPPSSLPSTPKPVVSPRAEKKAPLSPPPEQELKKLDKSDPKPEPPPEQKPGSKLDLRAGSRSELGPETQVDEDVSGTFSNHHYTISLTSFRIRLGKESSTWTPSIKSASSTTVMMTSREKWCTHSSPKQNKLSVQWTRLCTYYLLFSLPHSASSSNFPSEKKDLQELSSLGHFLKGSSAALGVSKVQKSCEKIQHYGNRRDEEVGVDLDEKEALSRIGQLLAQVKREYRVAEEFLKGFYPQSH